MTKNEMKLEIMQELKKWLYKYGAFILWTFIIIIYVYTNNIWLSTSVLLMSLMIGITYVDVYTGHIKAYHQESKLIENDCCITILSLIILCKDWKIILCFAILIGLYHMCRRNIIGTISHVKHITKHLLFIIHRPQHNK